MIKQILPKDIIVIHMKQASIEAIDLFHQRILTFSEGDEFAIKISPETYKSYFVLEGGTLSESDTYVIKNKNK